MTHYQGVVLASSKARSARIVEFFGLGEDWLCGSPVILRNGALRGHTVGNRVILDQDQVLSRDTQAQIEAAVSRVRGQGGLQAVRVSLVPL